MIKYENEVAEQLKMFIDRLSANNIEFDSVPEIRYDLRGQTAGQFHYAYQGSPAFIKLNKQLLEENGAEVYFHTLGHELAHYVDIELLGRNGRSGWRPHGVSFQRICDMLGVDSNRTHNMKTTKTRVMRKWQYRCECPEIKELSTIRHNRIVKGTRSYSCTKCKTTLRKV